MSNPVAWVKYEEIENNAGRFVVSPLTRGMGTTLGNSMRRVLLSSMRGAAVTSIKIDGVGHEFSTIPNVIEDVMDVICNIKGIIFKTDDEEPATVHLDFSGKGPVTADHIKCGDGIEIINTDQYIAELSDEGRLVIELVIQKGAGYSPAEANILPEQDINIINLDASFSPILRVNHLVENIRVGKELDYESLKLEVWTNGSLSPDDAVKQASSLLARQLGLFSNLNENPVGEVTQEVREDNKEVKCDSALNLTIDDLELSARSSNCLKRAGIETVGQLVEKGLSELIQIKNFGKKSADEINDKLKHYGLSLKGSLDDEILVMANEE